MSLSRPTARKFRKHLGAALAVCLVASAISALAASAASAASAPATCENQTFAQVFGAFGDENYYTLVPGGEFDSASEGWQLYNGAQITEATKPDGSTGGILDLPSGAVAVSPPICVTLLYPTARVWVRNAEGGGGVITAVAYVGSKVTVNAPQTVGQVHGQQTDWTLSNPINLQPQIAGAAEGAREVQFVFFAGGRGSDYQLSGLYVDPRML